MKSRGWFSGPLTAFAARSVSEAREGIVDAGSVTGREEVRMKGARSKCTLGVLSAHCVRGSLRVGARDGIVDAGIGDGL